MESFTEDLWAIVLARLSLKSSTASKLVCKQWKSIVESSFFRNLFLSLHQNSPSSSSWSLMSFSRRSIPVVAHYRCDTWGLEQSLGSLLKSFVTDKNQNPELEGGGVEAYSDVGLILIHVKSTDKKKGSLFVANPVSRECVEIFLDPLPKGFQTNEHLWQWGIATRTENGVLLGYKVVLFDTVKQRSETKLTCLIYSSETGLWSLETFHLPYFFHFRCFRYLISLNGNLHWLVTNSDGYQVLLSMDFYATSTGYDRCRATPFPDLEETTKFERACTTCQGFLMYMNVASATNGSLGLGDKLYLWRLRSEGWQLVSQISPAFILRDYLPLTIDPFDPRTAYFWSMGPERLLSINLHNGNLVVHNQFECSSDGHIMIPVNDPRAMISLSPTYIEHPYLLPFVLPQWLHRIPNTVRRAN